MFSTIKLCDKAVEWATHCFSPSRLTKVKLPWAFSSSASLILGGSILGFGFGTGLGSAPSARSKFSVLSAAPLSSIGIFRLNWALLKRNAPPAYVNLSGASKQLSQFIPSKGWTPPATCIRSSFPPRGGTIGSAPRNLKRLPCGAACTRVDVWMSESARDAQQAPTINDANGSATFVISPPLKKGFRFIRSNPITMTKPQATLRRPMGMVAAETPGWRRAKLCA